jgi:hypothetical protein
LYFLYPRRCGEYVLMYHAALLLLNTALHARCRTSTTTSRSS